MSRWWKLTLPLLCAACARSEPVAEAPTAGPVATFLHLNDTYRIEGTDGGQSGGLARVRGLRRELERDAPDLLVTHAGDMLGPSLLSRTYQGAQMVDLLDVLDGDSIRGDQRLVVTFGNHEFDARSMEAGIRLDRLVEGSGFRWLDSNIEWARGADGQPVVSAAGLQHSLLLDIGGLRVGMFSITIGTVRPEFVAAFGDPLDVARRESAGLRARGAQAIVALTHQPMDADLALFRALGDGGPDLILGGHDHKHQVEKVGHRLAVKADADAVTVAVVRLLLRGGRPEADVEFRTLNGPVLRDAAVAERVDSWLHRHADTYCAELHAPPGCLDEVFTRTNVRLVAEEEEIRRLETNLGSWLADRARSAFPAGQAQVALLNAGSLRLNRNLAAGEPITRQTLEELFAFPFPLRLLKVRGRVIREMLAHAITEWSSSGHWLQVSGIAFRHDPQAGTVTDITLLGDPARALGDDEEVGLVVGAYLVDQSGNQDGYTMLDPSAVVAEGPDLRVLTEAALRAAGEAGISPQKQGRICTVPESTPCLALPGPK